MVATGMAVALVERLEMVHVHHQHRQRLAVALGAGPLLAQYLVQAAAVGQAGQAVGGGQGRQALFGLLAAAQFAAQQQGQREDAHTEHPGGHADQDRSAAPGLEHVFGRMHHQYDQRQLRDPGESVHARFAVAAGAGGEAAALLAENAFEIGPLGIVAADPRVLRAAGLASQQLAVGVEQVDAAVIANVQALEQLAEVRQAQCTRCQAGELAIGVGDTPAETDAPVQVAQLCLERRAHQQAEVGVVQVRLEYPGVAEVGLAWHAAGGVAHHIALLVQPQHVTALAVDEGFIE
ncbi:hypothetical protein D3C75_682390 [compost metagenome]